MSGHNKTKQILSWSQEEKDEDCNNLAVLKESRKARSSKDFSAIWINLKSLCLDWSLRWVIQLVVLRLRNRKLGSEFHTSKPKIRQPISSARANWASISSSASFVSFSVRSRSDWAVEDTLASTHLFHSKPTWDIDTINVSIIMLQIIVLI